MTDRCLINGTLIKNDRRDGFGCPDHTNLKENGGTQTARQLESYYPENRSQYPHGRYCCGFCHAGRQPVGLGSSHGSRKPTIESQPKSTPKSCFRHVVPMVLAPFAGLVLQQCGIHFLIGIVAGAWIGYRARTRWKVAAFALLAAIASQVF